MKCCDGRVVAVGGFGGETRGERDHLEDLGVDGRIIFMWIFWKRDEREHGLNLSGSG